MDTGRLLALADFLDTRVPEADFDMSRWIARSYRPPTEGIPAGPPHLFGLLSGSPEVPPTPGCGFAGCAIGWAEHSGLFPGLRMINVNKDEKHRDGSKIMLATVPAYAGALQWDAINSLFKIGKDDQKYNPAAKGNKHWGLAGYLFHHATYPFNPGPKEVAARIREVVAASGHIAIPTDLPENVVPIRSGAAS